MFGGLLAHEKCIIQDKSWLDCMKPLPASYLIVSRSQWWGQSRLLASDLGLCSTLAEVWFAERWPHIQSPWQWQSIPPTRLWHHCKEKEMRRRKMKGGGRHLWLYKTSAASQLKPQHSGDRRKSKTIIIILIISIVLPIPSERGSEEKEVEPAEWETDAPSRCQQVRGAESPRRWEWRRVCERRRHPALRERTNIRWAFLLSSFHFYSYCTVYIFLVRIMFMKTQWNKPEHRYVKFEKTDKMKMHFEWLHSMFLATSYQLKLK